MTPDIEQERKRLAKAISRKLGGLNLDEERELGLLPTQRELALWEGLLAHASEPERGSNTRPFLALAEKWEGYYEAFTSPFWVVEGEGPDAMKGLRQCIDELKAALTESSASDVGGDKGCPACEGNPTAENNPCAVCGAKSASSSSTKGANVKPCVSCGEATKYICPFCKVYEGANIPLCEEAECREKHEHSELGCVRTQKVESLRRAE